MKPVKTNTSQILGNPLLYEVFQQILSEIQRNQARNNLIAPDDIVFEFAINGIHYSATCDGTVLRAEQNSLSPREKEIVRLIAHGLPNKTIASILDMSPWTVASHLRRIYAKLGVNSRAQMIAQVYDTGLLDQ